MSQNTHTKKNNNTRSHIQITTNYTKLYIDTAVNLWTNRLCVYVPEPLVLQSFYVGEDFSYPSKSIGGYLLLWCKSKYLCKDEKHYIRLAPHALLAFIV